MTNKANHMIEPLRNNQELENFSRFDFLSFFATGMSSMQSAGLFCSMSVAPK
jgi:hypothetical protein